MAEAECMVYCLYQINSSVPAYNVPPLFQIVNVSILKKPQGW